ncbi:MAG TPA: helix-turn-helix domain-containing protein [Pseudonocardia sp.]|nr:helix-turn-helix domain-containing protein [Pseudonocardia sp.]
MNERASELVGELARDFRDKLPELTPRMSAMFIEVIPEFRHDEAVQRLMVASTGSNLAVVIDMLMLGISLEDISVPAAAAEYARRFAQHDMSLEALLRAYRLGEHMMLEWFIDAIEARDVSTTDALAATRRVAALINGYIDQIIAELTDIYQSERDRWEQRSESVRAAQIRAVLTTEGLETSAAEEMLGVSLRGWHIATVAWTAETGAESVLRGVGRLLSEVAGRTPLTIFADSATVWAWVRYPTTPALDTGLLATRLAEHPGLRISLGEPGAGVAGFRASHTEALRARKVAELEGQTKQQVYRHSPLALAGLLIEQRDEVALWVRRTLGKLAADNESSARLRETLRIFLELSGSFNDTAARMHVHKNTVLYRVRKAEEILGHSINDGRLPVEVALHLCDQLALAASTSIAKSQAG